jgi:hypothetical protein
VSGEVGRADRDRLGCSRLAVQLGLLFLLVLSMLGNWAASRGATVDAHLPGLTVGVTHGESSVDPLNPAAAVSRARGVLEEVAPVQNQHLMGWGALNPEPSPGVFDFSSLDRRMNMITAMGAEPVVTLCCAPDWMKGGSAGSTDWSRIEDAPTPAHFDDFARLAQVTALRYPQVRRFIVWNELKGFFDEKRDDWDVKGYTELYNRVYEAVKKVRPDALVGGPYIGIDSWSAPSAYSHSSPLSGSWGVVDRRSLGVIDYWLGHAVGADFIALDGGTATHDRGLTTTDFEAVGKLSAVTEWVRTRSDLPIWWTEIYPECSDRSATAADPRRAAVMADALVALARAGASVALIWQPQAGAELQSAALFTDTTDPGGGQALPLVGLLQAMESHLRRDPRSVVTSWDPSRSLWTLTTPDGITSWSPGSGLRGPS